jgi:hypothetical protein
MIPLARSSPSPARDSLRSLSPNGGERQGEGEMRDRAQAVP